jgi:predicted homoserine dehydrogenase-like protein
MGEEASPMNLDHLLQQRAATDGPVRVGLIGAGKFGTMYLAQAQHITTIHIVAIADLEPQHAHAAAAAAGWDPAQTTALDFADALASGATFITDDTDALIAHPQLDVVIDATGSPSAGIRHVRACCREGKHIIMVNVEADALAGPQLAREADQAGIVYSLAYGDQPALICELVDWARTSGLDIIAAGKGTKYLPSYHTSTPDTVWGYYGLTTAQAEAGGMNPRMFNSFLDGTKSAIEMAAVANATGLTPAPNGLAFPPCSPDDLASILRPSADGGQLHHAGQVEVISSLERDGRPLPRDLRWGVYVVFRAPNEYAARCFKEYGLITDETGQFSAIYRPYHLVGLELAVSVASVALRGEPTGAPRGFVADVVAVAKHDIPAGETLDGEGGYTVWGKLMPAADSVAQGALPIGLAHGVELQRPVAAGELIRSDIVNLAAGNEAVRVRRDLERHFAVARITDEDQHAGGR